MSDSEEEPKIAQGFDRGIDYQEIKDKFLKHLNRLYKYLQKADTRYETKVLTNKICYIMIAMIQLRNGSRISEACSAFVQFINSDDLDDKVVVKIAKSQKNTEKIKTKARYRKMVFPDWIDRDIFEEVRDSKPLVLLIQNKRLKKRVLDYMLMYFNCNTHSLRYACINYLLTDMKLPMPTVAKYVGHINTNQLCTYTQNKEVDKIFDLDI